MFHNLGADKEKARSAVLLSALEIVFGTNKEILFRERRPGREGTWRRIKKKERKEKLNIWIIFIFQPVSSVFAALS